MRNASAAPSPFAAHEARPAPSRRASGSTAGGGGSSDIGQVECAADALLKLGIADRDQPGKHQPAAAGADEGIGDAPNRAIVGKQDAARCQRHRLRAEPGKQPGNEGVGERTMRRNSEDGGLPGRRACTLRHS